MVVYDHISDLPPDPREAITDMLRSDEALLVAVREEKLLSRLSPFFVLTDRRLIRYRKRWLGYSEEMSDTPLDRLSHINWQEANFGKTGDLELRGPEFEESIALLGDDGRALADALRDQLAARKEVA